MKRWMGVVGTAVLLGGCVNTNSVLFDPTARYAPVHESQVRIFLDREDVPWEHEDVALIHADADETFTNEADLLEAIREEAARLGADGVVLSWMEEPTSADRLADWVVDGDIARRRGQAVAIRRVGSSG